VLCLAACVVNLAQVHEFGHHIHNLVLPDCVAKAADVAHAHAVASGSYTPGRYMVSSVFEYMANAAAAWFQVRRLGPASAAAAVQPACHTELYVSRKIGPAAAGSTPRQARDLMKCLQHCQTVTSVLKQCCSYSYRDVCMLHVICSI
jgi:hypothetical protein